MTNPDLAAPHSARLDAFNLDRFNTFIPDDLAPIVADTEALGFDMSCFNGAGQLLRFLVSTKPGGRFLEIGTGTGVGAAWLRSGMDPASTLTSVELDDRVATVARKHLGGDKRLTFVTGDGAEFLRAQRPGTYDLIFADTVPGKYELVRETLALLKPGGIYAVDDILPQEDWPADHYPLATSMIDRLVSLDGVVSVGITWSSGLALFTNADRSH
jgi:predicted O-methyltransferase YrrM